ncbi:hydroxymethylglutaryl-CoA reductase [Geomicrobium sp. JCM 19038]|nr:hydroxymethylglutaryl-CoA reductase, degradative [Geomicrobium sp. JCM 19038]GAK09477.1 hydroxymethylglutaryl-CoA reductase [Geomicrobium sp. JCM 19038]
MKHTFTKFHEKSMEDRKAAVFAFSQLNEEAKSLYCNSEYDQLSDQLVENAIGVMEIPLGVAVNFVINDIERVIPMATEESSVIAAASHGAKLARSLGGFHAQVDGSYMFSQIHIVHVQDPYAAKVKILHHRDELIGLANQEDPILQQLGGGAYDITVRAQEDPSSLVVHLHVDTLDAMGANAANTMAEKIAPRIEEITSGEARLKIISNLADRRIVRVYCEVQHEQLGGADVVDRIVQACDIAKRDPYRAATHNKGIMNGIIPIVLATGNDTRAVEAGLMHMLVKVSTTHH